MEGNAARASANASRIVFSASPRKGENISALFRDTNEHPEKESLKTAL